MKNSINPRKIESQVNNGTLSKKNASELLISLFNNEKDPKLRVRYLDLFGRYFQKDLKYFEILENILISDQNAQLRTKAAEILIRNFPVESIKSLIWEINNEKSPIVLQKLFSIIQSSRDSKIKKLKPLVQKWFESFGNKININSKEAEFILETESLFEKKQIISEINEHTYKFYKILHKIEESEDRNWIKTQNNHILELKFNFYKWKFIRKYPGQLISLKKYRDLDLLLSLLIQMSLKSLNNISLPSSIECLEKLERIDLSQNYFETLPESLGNLKNLKYLDLSYNRLNQIPELLINLKNLKYLDLRFNNIKRVPLFLKDMKKLNSIYLSGNKIRKIPSFLDSIVSS